MIVKIIWHMTLCRPVDEYRRFRGTCRVHIQGLPIQMEISPALRYLSTNYKASQSTVTINVMFYIQETSWSRTFLRRQ